MMEARLKRRDPNPRRSAAARDGPNGRASGHRIAFAALGIVAALAAGVAVTPAVGQTMPPSPQGAMPPGANAPAQAGSGNNPSAVPPPAVGVVPTQPVSTGQTGRSPSGSNAPGTSVLDMARLATPTSLQSVQHAWSIGVPAPQQSSPGVKRVSWDGSVVFVTTRLYVYTSILLPQCEVVEQVLMGDTLNFAFRLDEADSTNPAYRPARNRIDIMPRGHVGIDTTATVVTASGRVYPFYLVATDVDAVDIPDVIVQIEGARLCGAGGDIGSHVLHRGGSMPPSFASSSAGAPALHAAALPGQRGMDNLLARPPGFPPPPSTGPQAGTGQSAGSGDYLREVPLAVQDLRFDAVQILVPDEASRAIAPLRVFDDGRWTYIDFGIDRIDSMRLPQAFVMEDDADHLANTAMTGERGEILIVKAIGDVVLKSGRLYVCLPRRRAGIETLWSGWKKSREGD